MSDADRLKTAVGLVNSGDRKTASSLLFPFYKEMKDQETKLQSILALMTAFDPLTDMDKMAQACQEGIKLAKDIGDEDAYIYLIGEKAVQLQSLASMLSHMMRNLTLAPGWFGFATEIEKTQYERASYDRRIGLQENEGLFKEALSLAEKSSQADLKARILLMLGQDFGSKYIDHKADNMLLNRRFLLKITNKLFWIRRFNLDNYLLLNKNDRKMLNFYVQRCRQSYLEAAEIYKNLGREYDLAYAFYNLGHQLRFTNRFKEASRYIRKAEIIAKKHNNRPLLKNIAEVKKDIKSRNRTIPNYLEGETRESL